MKNILVSALLVIMVGCKGGNIGYDITVKLDDDHKFKHAVLYNSQFDSIVYKGIQSQTEFKLRGKLDSIEQAHLYVQPDGYVLPIILENESYTIVIENDLLVCKGGRLNDIVYGYKQQLGYQLAKKEAKYKSDSLLPLIKKSMENDNPHKVLALREMFWGYVNNHRSKKYAYQQNILEGDYPTIAKVLIMNDNHHDEKNFPPARKVQMLEAFKAELGPLPLITKLLEESENKLKLSVNAEKVSVGMQFHDITLETAEGKLVQLSEVVKQNKYTLLDFWASWCGPCRGEFPHFNNVYEKYHDQGFEIYTVSVDDNRDKWLKAREKETMPWIDVHDTLGYKSEIKGAYGVGSIPAGFLIDNSGKIVAKSKEVRNYALEDLLKGLFPDS